MCKLVKVTSSNIPFHADKKLAKEFHQLGHQQADPSHQLKQSASSTDSSDDRDDRAEDEWESKQPAQQADDEHEEKQREQGNMQSMRSESRKLLHNAGAMASAPSSAQAQLPVDPTGPAPLDGDGDGLAAGGTDEAPDGELDGDDGDQEYNGVNAIDHASEKVASEA